MGAASVFAHRFHELFTTYRATLALRDRLVGGTPMDTKIIEAWLRHRAGIEGDEEIRRALVRTLGELGAEVRPEMTYEELERASEGLAASRNTNGFKRGPAGLYVEGRIVKAALREAVNILYGGERWGKTRKGPKSFFAERVFVDPDVIPLGVVEPAGVELFIGHVSGASGPQSTLTYHEYVLRPLLEVEVIVMRDEITEEQWPMIWLEAQELGVGALRSQGFGRYDLTRWERGERSLDPSRLSALLATAGDDG